jgi:hypothetical protein
MAGGVNACFDHSYYGQQLGIVSFSHESEGRNTTYILVIEANWVGCLLLLPVLLLLSLPAGGPVLHRKCSMGAVRPRSDCIRGRCWAVGGLGLFTSGRPRITRYLMENHPLWCSPPYIYIYSQQLDDWRSIFWGFSFPAQQPGPSKLDNRRGRGW